jgi:hypothetical protein
MDTCNYYQITLYLSKYSTVKYPDAKGIFLSGFFYPPACGLPGKLAVATRRTPDHVLNTLVHEFSHLVQWATRCRYYVSVENAIQIFDNWVAGKDYDQKTIQAATYALVLLEKECEELAVKHIQEFALPIDTVDYIKKANAYILSYWGMEKTHKWNENPPQYNSQIVDKMPDNFTDLDYKNPPQELIEEIVK